jgi:capsular exopolysaccharide synthesis family protein
VPGELLSLKMRMTSMDEIIEMLDDDQLSTVEKLSLIKKFRGKPVPVGTIVRNTLPENVVRTTPVGVSSTTSNPASGDQSTAAAAGVAPAGAQIVVVPSMVEELEPWERTERELRSAKQERDHLAETFLPGHELMRAIDAKIAKLVLALEDEFRIAKSSFLLEREHMNEKFAELQKKMPDYRRVLNDFDKYKQDYNLLSSGRVAWENAYANLKKRVSEMDYTGSELISDLSFQGFTMLRDMDPVSPNKKSLLIYGLALGLALGGGVSFSFEKFRSSTSLVSDTEQLTGLRALGVLPLTASNDDFRRLFVSGQTSNETGYDLRESFRIVRSSLPLHVPQDNKCQVLLITSARPGEGKTVASSLLARSFADSGEKTILIDADLRRGRVEQLLEVAVGRGLSSYLVGETTDFGDCITHMPGSKLDVVARGAYSSLAVEELGRPRFADLIRDLRSQYSRIIIDTPPTLGLADALTIIPVIDGIVFVIRAEKTTQRDILSGIEPLVTSGAPIYGFVLNGVDLGKIENYYYYSSYYPKYYDPGYNYSVS